MLPIYLTGHSRPVRKVMFNFDGDLLFTCSDDASVHLYRTSDCQRIGVFKLKDACKSFDLSKDSSMLLVATTISGVFLFDVMTGKQLSNVKVPGHMTKHAEFSLGEKKALVQYDFNKMSYVRIFQTSKMLKNDEK